MIMQFYSKGVGHATMGIVLVKKVQKRDLHYMIWAFYLLLLTTGPVNIRLAEYNSQITYTSQFYSISVMLSRPCNDIFVLFIPFFKPLMSP